jgi:hypothetical protein
MIDGLILLPTAQTGASAFQKLLDFLKKLDANKFSYRLTHFREETIAVELAVPGERWEVEFFADGTVEIERFRSNGVVSPDETILNELFSTFA